MDDFIIEGFAPEQNDELLALTRKASVRRKFSLSLDRGDEHSALLRAASDDFETLVAMDEESGQVYGYGDSIYYRLSFRGDYRLFNYGAMGIVDPDLQKRHIGRGIFTRYVQNMRDRGAEGFYIVINPRNRQMNNFVRRYPAFEGFRAYPFRLNYVLFARRYAPSSLFSYRRATREDLPEIAALLRTNLVDKFLYPRVSAESLAASLHRLPAFDLEDVFLATYGGRIVAAVALWDQRSLKRIKLVDCSPMGRVLRAMVNAKARFSGFTPLPADGEFYSIYQTMFIASEEQHPFPLKSLIQHVCNEKYGEGHHFVNIVMAHGDPLLAALRGILRMGEDNTYYLVVFDEEARRAIPQGKTPYLNYSFS